MQFTHILAASSRRLQSQFAARSQRFARCMCTVHDGPVASNGDDASGPSHEDMLPNQPSDEDFLAGDSTLGRGAKPYKKGDDTARRGSRTRDLQSSDQAFQRWQSEEERYSSVDAPFSVAEPRLRLLYKEYLRLQDGSATALVSSGDQRELPLGYCACCHHGTDILQPDNTKLLSLFLADDGSLLPRRLTKMCSKHQNKLSRVIKQARDLNFLPFHSKLHPKLRFTSVTPANAAEAAAAASSIAEEEVRSNLEELGEVRQ